MVVFQVYIRDKVKTFLIFVDDETFLSFKLNWKVVQDIHHHHEWVLKVFQSFKSSKKLLTFIRQFSHLGYFM